MLIVRRQTPSRDPHPVPTLSPDASVAGQPAHLSLGAGGGGTRPRPTSHSWVCEALRGEAICPRPRTRKLVAPVSLPSLVTGIEPFSSEHLLGGPGRRRGSAVREADVRGQGPDRRGARHTSTPTLAPLRRARGLQGAPSANQWPGAVSAQVGSACPRSHPKLGPQLGLTALSTLAAWGVPGDSSVTPTGRPSPRVRRGGSVGGEHRSPQF